jgi:predicted RNA binding protein YcfA (HicA-like mRNA interferase family)
MRPFKWKELRILAEAKGFKFDRHRGDHYIMARAGAARPVVIPMKNNLKEDIVKSVARTIGMSQAELTKYVRQPKTSHRKLDN